MYIIQRTKPSVDTISVRPRMMLPTPTMGKVGWAPLMTRPLRSMMVYSCEWRRAIQYEIMAMRPDSRNSVPMASVSHLTPLSGNFNSSTPMTIEQMARKMELCSSFIVVNIFKGDTKVVLFSHIVSSKPKILHRTPRDLTYFHTKT